ncbi:hypothetical protein [Bosea sp. NBC_00550]|uniref:hypothetical protein n=1 Tax=Bosea sp. NBC_00550 TaxID=2969621 RepID=UPI002232223F|nr:hypothetical protein [Bosea sp. NBC_00550]UZF90646.1 hypothetical protein NWE53_16030 [Bosea sp. NBC_00550]
MSETEEDAAPTGPDLGATFDHHLNCFLTNSDPAERDKAAGQVRAVLDLFQMLAEPVRAHERAVLAAEADNSGAMIDAWTEYEIETDPAKVAVVRRVAAQLLCANPGLLAGHQQQLLALRLLDLNNGRVGLLLEPSPRPSGGAGIGARDQKVGLGTLFWMRKGWDATTRAATLKLFAELMSDDEHTVEERSVRRVAYAVAESERSLWEALGAHRAGRSIEAIYYSFVRAMGREKIPDPTDVVIRATAKRTD